MNLLVILPYKGYFSNFRDHLVNCLDGRDGLPGAAVTTVTPPFYRCYTKAKKFLSKRQIASVMVRNCFYLFYRLVVRDRKKYDVIVLASHVVAIPFLLVAKLFPFMNARKRIVVMSFFLHGLGEKRFVQRVLRFLLSHKGVILVAQSEHEVGYYSELMGESRVVYYPFCQHELTVSHDCGQGQEYVFAGGFTNRDYECLFGAARKVESRFVVICSELNQIERVSETPENVKVLMDTSHSDFNGYVSNARVVVIPLKEKTGSSGQMVALSAMALKKAVIYTNIDSVSQYFDDGVSGVSYELNNVEDLAAKIRTLLSSPQLCEQLGANAYRRYCEKYHIAKYCEFLADLIVK